MDLFNGEYEKGSWMLKYLPPNGGRYSGKLLVTNLRVLFDSNTIYHSHEIQELLILSGKKNYLSINKNEIKNIRMKNKILYSRLSFEIGGKKHHLNSRVFFSKKIYKAIIS